MKVMYQYTLYVLICFLYVNAAKIIANGSNTWHDPSEVELVRNRVEWSFLASAKRVLSFNPLHEHIGVLPLRRAKQSSPLGTSDALSFVTTRAKSSLRGERSELLSLAQAK